LWQPRVDVKKWNGLVFPPVAFPIRIVEPNVICYRFSHGFLLL
uniref:Neur_chan_LBD domain-containing protein n=1 Tax=Gongylonema pulchrum TaxID=637853 RepID=A0A183DFJ3_9BILA